MTTHTPREEDWFQASLNRRDTAKLGLGVAAVAALAGCGDGSKVEDMDSMAAQKKGGWDVGDIGVPLLFPTGTKSIDSKAGPVEVREPAKLLSIIKPNDPKLATEQMPSLVQALSETTLSLKMKAVSSPQTEESYRQARALGATLSSIENPEKTVLIVDLPTAHGPAAAAGMAEFVEPVFIYDNWPHPKGVVKSQDTLGSLLYYARELEEKKAARASKTAVPAAYILDSTRLNNGKEPSTNEFDNRYFVAVPDADALKARGVQNVMLVTLRDAAKETDDINDAIADYKDGGIKVSNIPLSSFKRDPAYKAEKDHDNPTRGYFYGGSHHHHTGFYHHYPMFLYIPMGRYGWGRSVTRTMPTTMRAPSYAPTRRATAFSSRTTGGAKGIGRAKPAGFGRVSTRVSKSGRILGTKTGSVGRYRSSRSFGG